MAGEQIGIGEPVQRYFKVTPIRDPIEQFVGKFAAEDGTDLSDFLGWHPSRMACVMSGAR